MMNQLIFLFFAWILLLIKAIEAKKCTPPFRYHHELNRCYVSSSEKVTYNEAYSSCLSDFGGSLPSIHNGFQNQMFLDATDQDSIPFWLGLYRPDPRTKVWKWTDGSPVDYLNWEVVPSDLNKTSIMQANGKWVSENENAKHSFFCVETEKNWACPKGWTKFNQTNKCYVTIYEMTFNEGEAYCKQFGGHLTSIHNKEEEEFVYQLSFVPCEGEAGGPHEVALGAQWDPNEKRLVGWTDGSPADYVGNKCFDSGGTLIRLAAVDKCGSCQPKDWLIGYGNPDDHFTRLVCKANLNGAVPINP